MSGLFSSGVSLVVFLAILVGLVVAHEFGHFIVARLSGVRVHEFGIGFPPRAARLGSDGETEYTLNWLPIGGFVRLEGEDGDSDDPRSFTRKSLPVRVTILLAGVAMNLLVAFVIFTVIAAALEPNADAQVDSVVPGTPAAAIGLRPGDLITAVNGQSFPYFDAQAPTSYTLAHAGDRVTLTVHTVAGGTRQIPVTLQDQAAVNAGKGALGITARIVPGAIVQRSLGAAIGVGADRTVQACGLIVGALGQLVSSVASNPGAAPPVSGPIGIAEMVGTVRTEAPPVVLLWLIGLLSANLAVVNVLPFPPLDGGRIVVSVLQTASRNRISASLERATYFVGFVLLFGFLIWVSYFDIVRGGAGS
ncbi:MAG: M50 family metallopeptidase [Candidatus Limnocylindrales bacterium]